MAVTIRVKRGSESQILAGAISIGELCFATDTCSLYSFNGITKCLVGRAVVDSVSNISYYGGLAGRFFYASDTKDLYIHNGVNWDNVTSSGYYGDVTLSGVNGITTTYSGGIWYIDGSALNYISPVSIRGMVIGFGTFLAAGRTITHDLGTTFHYSAASPSSTDEFDERDIASIGEIYVKLGSNTDTVYHTGGSRANGLPFYWLATTASGLIDLDSYSTTSGIQDWVNTQLTTVSAAIVEQIPAVTLSGNIMGSGLFSATGTSIAHNLGTTSHYVSITPADTIVYNERNIAAIGIIYVQKGADTDIVYHTGGPRADGLKFDWEVIKHGLRMVE